MVDAYKVEPLDAYSELIRNLHIKYGQKRWFIIYQADTRLCSETFERWLRREETKGGQTDMNPERKWDFLFMSAANPEYNPVTAFWAEEAKDKINAYSSWDKSFAEVVDDGTIHNSRHPHTGRRASADTRPAGSPRKRKFPAPLLPRAVQTQHVTKAQPQRSTGKSAIATTKASLVTPD
jgi:hypothetical protein